MGRGTRLTGMSWVSSNRAVPESWSPNRLTWRKSCQLAVSETRFLRHSAKYNHNQTWHNDKIENFYIMTRGENRLKI